jgi:B12-binding domain/radical SAM domain protein
MSFMRLFSQPDLIFLHPPSVYDFRKRPIMFGPISDVIPSTAIFEMYPVGFSSMAQYLERHGFHVRILNLALLMLKDRRFDAQATIQRLRPKAFGIDLHWLPHVQGSIEVARICKSHHPKVPVIFGGFSASYFHEELLARPEVDFVIRGDSTEEPLRLLIQALARGQGPAFHQIPNLAWRDETGQIVANPLTHLPETLDHYADAYGYMMRSAIRHLDIRGMLPIHDWWSYPITAVMTCRGCVHRCSFCGGSHPGLKLFGNRAKPAFRSPEKIVQDILQIARFTSAPIFVVGDLRQAGEGYADAVLDGIRGHRVENHVVLELFTCAAADYFRKLSKAFPNFNLEMSPESHDQQVRQASGKLYTNDQLEETIGAALDAGCKKFDLFFMIGLPKQTPFSVMGTIDYCEDLLQRFGSRLVPFISPLAPFIDPGSPIFEDAETFGYTLFYRTLEEFRTALLQPSWKHALSYETRWMSRDQIAEATYEAALRLNRIKGRFGLLDHATCQAVEERILLAKRVMRRIDEVMGLPSPERDQALLALRGDMDRVNASTLCEEREIKWPVLSRNFHFLRIAWSLLRG